MSTEDSGDVRVALDDLREVRLALLTDLVHERGVQVHRRWWKHTSAGSSWGASESTLSSRPSVLSSRMP
ncbi:hypothetical protein [Actinophytocola sp.]|uniref:hypothetical protein n=1 Tax=Actinophytocola sp. TaxID=1872138 RepID=UPI00345B8783